MEAATNALLALTAGSSCLGGFLTLGSKMKSVKLLYREILAMVKRGKDIIFSTKKNYNISFHLFPNN